MVLWQRMRARYGHDIVQFWDRQKDALASKINLSCPGKVNLYNVNMWGVDKMDTLLGFYR